MLVHDGHTNARKFFTRANADSYDSVVSLATFGRDINWKRLILQAIIQKDNDSILELACGTGILSIVLAKNGMNVTGLDLTYEYLAKAMRRIDLPLAQGTAEILPYRNELFDVIVSSYLIKYVDVQKVVEECWRVLKQNGTVVFHDFTYPANKMMRVVWNTYFIILRMIGGFVRSWKPVFEDLDEVISKSNWIVWTQDALCERGFEDISCKYYTAGTAAIITARKP